MKLYCKVMLYVMVFLLSTFIISKVIMTILRPEFYLIGKISILTLAIIFSLFYSGYVVEKFDNFILRRNNKKNQDNDKKMEE